MTSGLEPLIFLGIFLMITKWLPCFTHCVCNQGWKKRDRPEWIINFFYLESKTFSEGLPSILQTSLYVTPFMRLNVGHMPPSPAARTAGKVGAGPSWLDYLIPPLKKCELCKLGRWQEWILDRLYYLLCSILIHQITYLSFIKLSTVWCHTHCILFIFVSPIPNTALWHLLC